MQILPQSFFTNKKKISFYKKGFCVKYLNYSIKFKMIQKVVGIVTKVFSVYIFGIHAQHFSSSSPSPSKNKSKKLKI